MVTLFDMNLAEQGRQSSKGNQLKWKDGDVFYKADYLGYEGLAEYVCGELLKESSLAAEEFVQYETEEIRYGTRIYTGCKSRSFLKDGWQLFTLERLFANRYGRSFYKSIWSLDGVEERIRFLVEMTEALTGLKDAGAYFCKLLEVDALFLNEDRHLHNIAVLSDAQGKFHFCPIFDQGAGLLSDTSMDYPMEGEIYQLIDSCKAKTVCANFSEALEAVENLYGQQIRFRFTYERIREILRNEKYYSEETKERVLRILMEQRRKYSYLFS